MIILDILLHSNSRRPGFWKLNTSLLLEMDYVNQIKTTIQETREEYNDPELVNPSLLWEMIKLKVREKSIYYSKTKNKQNKQREFELEQVIAKLEGKIDSIDIRDPQLFLFENQLNRQKSELEISWNIALKVQF